ncbi:hypothetical protein PAHAL_3G514500 [Panicum hallii]|uniref:Uncharacterized protein n=1 Tax=Panicum hallii TaxID=206008 RepID=A0A2T8KME7_9POAL|nr:hypothetical protein PAHAL_3G514500 [Panicum hallii]
MCLSILPRRISAGSSLSLWLVVKMMMRSPPHADQRPSMKFSSPESVTLVPSSLSGSTGSMGLPSASSSDFFFCAFLSLRLPVRSTEQSMSSMTMMDLPVVSMKSLRSSVLFFTAVSSRS